MSIAGVGRRVTSAALAALSGLHFAWAVGSTCPVADRGELADLVAGSDEMPGPQECAAVGGLLATAALLVAGPGWLPTGVRRLGALGVAVVLAGRATLGVTGRTGLVVPWTPSERFRRIDRRCYAPLCAALASGAAVAAASS